MLFAFLLLHGLSNKRRLPRTTVVAGVVIEIIEVNRQVQEFTGCIGLRFTLIGLLSVERNFPSCYGNIPKDNVKCIGTLQFLEATSEHHRNRWPNNTHNCFTQFVAQFYFKDLSGSEITWMAATF